MVHIYEAMKPQLTLQQSISKRISIHPCCKGSEDQVSYLSRMLDGEHIDYCVHFFLLFQNSGICVPSVFFLVI